MTLNAARSVIAALNRLDITPPVEVTDSLTSTDALIVLHRRLAASITPTVNGGLPAAEEAARRRGIGLLTEAALAGTLDQDLALIAADDIATTQTQVGRIRLALELINTAAGGAATNPIASDTVAELSLAAAADDIFAVMHARVRTIIAAVPAHLNALGGSLPADPGFAAVATKEALAAYRAIDTAGQLYAELRSAQRQLLNIAEGAETAAGLWMQAEIRGGFRSPDRGNDRLYNWASDTQDEPTVEQAMQIPVSGPEATRRLVHHAGYSDRVWVPSTDQLRKAVAQHRHESSFGMDDHITGYRTPAAAQS